MPKETKSRSLHPALPSKLARIKTVLTTADADKVRTRYELGTTVLNRAECGASLAACSAGDVVDEERARCPSRMFQRSGRRFQRRCLRWDKGRTGLPLRSPSTHTSRLPHILRDQPLGSRASDCTTVQQRAHPVARGVNRNAVLCTARRLLPASRGGIAQVWTRRTGEEGRRW
jgi:hypothetical protein